jgi:hypothetical protein
MLHLSLIEGYLRFLIVNSAITTLFNLIVIGLFLIIYYKIMHIIYGVIFIRHVSYNYAKYNTIIQLKFIMHLALRHIFCKGIALKNYS